MENVRTVILGVGRGARLFPLTKERAKPSVPIAGKFRLIDIPLSNCMHSELREVFILTQFNSASLIHHVSETYHFSAAAGRSVRILAAAQTPTTTDWFQGTADAVRQNLRHLVDAPDRPAHILVLAGDHLYRMDYRQMLARHVETGADITVSTVRVAPHEAGRFGILRMDPGGRITRFVEKPSTPEALGGLESVLENADGTTATGYLGSMGIYVFRTPVLLEVLEDPTNVDFRSDILPRSIDCRGVYGYSFDGYWEDIGTIRSFYEANLGLLDVVPRFNFYDESAPVYTFGHNLPDTKVNESYIRSSILAEGSIIDRSEIIRSIVGLRCVVGCDTRVESSMLMGADYYESHQQIQAHLAQGTPPMGIGRGCQIRGAIIDKNAHIGDGVILTNPAGIREADAEDYYIRDHLVIVPRGGVIRPGMVV
ncbi:MAG: sugar phosphate nucleotidyltransferase [Candidatus Latescibacterota bacterium]